MKNTFVKIVRKVVETAQLLLTAANASMVSLFSQEEASTLEDAWNVLPSVRFAM